MGLGSRTWAGIAVAAGLAACGAKAGEPCTFDEATYGTACDDGRLLSCADGVWVDIGTEMEPDVDDPDVVGGPSCACQRPNVVACTYVEY